MINNADSTLKIDSAIKVIADTKRAKIISSIAVAVILGISTVLCCKKVFPVLDIGIGALSSCGAVIVIAIAYCKRKNSQAIENQKHLIKAHSLEEYKGMLDLDQNNLHIHKFPDGLVSDYFEKTKSDSEWQIHRDFASNSVFTINGKSILQDSTKLRELVSQLVSEQEVDGIIQKASEISDPVKFQEEMAAKFSAPLPESLRMAYLTARWDEFSAIPEEDMPFKVKRAGAQSFFADINKVLYKEYWNQDAGVVFFPDDMHVNYKTGERWIIELKPTIFLSDISSGHKKNFAVIHPTLTMDLEVGTTTLEWRSPKTL